MSNIPLEYVDTVPTLRAGPDRLSDVCFLAPLKPVQWACYAFRDHTSCAEPECNCRSVGRRGEGLCLVSFADGTFALYSLDQLAGEAALRWEFRRLRSRHGALTETEVRALAAVPASFDGHPAWRELADGVAPGLAEQMLAGLGRAAAVALQRGWLDGGAPPLATPLRAPMPRWLRR